MTKLNYYTDAERARAVEEAREATELKKLSERADMEALKAELKKILQDIENSEQRIRENEKKIEKYERIINANQQKTIVNETKWLEQITNSNKIKSIISENSIDQYTHIKITDHQKVDDNLTEER